MPYLWNGLTEFNETLYEYLLSLGHGCYVYFFQIACGMLELLPFVTLKLPIWCYISVTYGQIQLKIDLSIFYQESINTMYNFSTLLVACWSYCPFLLKKSFFSPPDAPSLKRLARIQWNFKWIFVITGAWIPCILFPDCLWHLGVIALCYSKITYMMLYLCNLWTDST